MSDPIADAIERYAIRPLPGQTCCVFDRDNLDAPAEFCGTIEEGKRVLLEKRAAAVRAVVSTERE